MVGNDKVESFKYDPFGRRIYKSSSSATSIYAYDGSDLIEETNSAGAAVARYAQSADKIDEPLAMLRSGTTNYYDADGLSSITSLSSSAGALTQTYTFDSFGKLTNSSGSLTNWFQYTGREFDAETSLYYYRARYYDPSTGRFLSEDPIGFSGGGNFYRFALNSPIGFNDPMGLSPADVGRIKNGCKKCTQDLTDAGLRRPGSGAFNGAVNDQQSLWPGLWNCIVHGNCSFGGKQGCKSQATLTKPCLENAVPPYDGDWKFDTVPWWGGSHTIVKGQDSDPNDPIVYCDPWRNYSWTAPKNPDLWPHYSKF